MDKPTNLHTQQITPKQFFLQIHGEVAGQLSCHYLEIFEHQANGKSENKTIEINFESVVARKLNYCSIIPE